MSRIEQNIVILAACIPTLRPFFTRFFTPRYGSGKTGNTKNSQGHALTSIGATCADDSAKTVDNLQSSVLGKGQSISELALSKRGEEDSVCDSDDSIRERATPSALGDFSRDADDDDRSQNSRQGILKTVDVSMRWHTDGSSEHESGGSSYQRGGRARPMASRHGSMSETHRRQIVPESSCEGCDDGPGR